MPVLNFILIDSDVRNYWSITEALEAFTDISMRAETETRSALLSIYLFCVVIQTITSKRMMKTKGDYVKFQYYLWRRRWLKHGSKPNLSSK